MSAPSTPSTATRSSGGFRRDKWGNYVSHTTLLAPRSFHNLHIYVQPDDGPRVCVDQDPMYTQLRDLVAIVFNHVIGSKRATDTILGIIELILPVAQNQLDSQIPVPDQTALQDFLLEDTPTIILKNLSPPKSSKPSLSWGLVQKGDATDAAANELYLLKELAETLQNAPPPNLTEEEVNRQHAHHRLLITVTLLHEMVRAFTKRIFSPAFITPSLGNLEEDEDGQGESGATFERNYLHFKLQAVWHRDSFALPHRMWYITHLVAANLFARGTVILDLESVEALQKSFERTLIFMPQWELPCYHHNSDHFVRYRLGSGVEVEEEDGEVVEENDVIMSETCLPRNVGLGIFITPPDV
ncbi:hypothetical protein C8R45DRAFT_954279 [Mycena sanguinolenta]|nr:hypothetical protein C8R45DRAFT_954279 [Mycena sanguinolenta]